MMQKRSKGIFAAAAILTTVWSGSCQAAGILFQTGLVAGTVAPDLVVRVFLAADLVIDRDNAE